MKSKAKVTLIIISIIAGAFLLTLSGCSFRKISRFKGIVYQNAVKSVPEQHLNIFAPEKHSKLCDVIIFVHGGNWNSGKKSHYNIIGGHWARKGIVYVVIDYPLSPAAGFEKMANATAKSVRWVKEHILAYGGNPDRIFISGHSAGGHLAALVSIDNSYFKQAGIDNPLAGTILIDAAGLDMHGYLTDEKLDEGHTYLRTFTSDPVVWKKATPLYHLHQNLPPMLIFRGGKTYPSIQVSNEKFIKALQDYAPETAYVIQEKKKHIPMVTQFFNPWNPRYDQIIEFMKKVKGKRPSSQPAADAQIGGQ
jgi:acetyl esterase/lipase